MNGATAVVYESLRGNFVFVARLIDSGNLVLVHPMKSWLAGIFVTYVLSEAGQKVFFKIGVFQKMK